MALHSSLDMLTLSGLACFWTLAMSALHSSASDGFRFWPDTSAAEIYSWYGGILGVTAKLGPCASTFSWAVDRGLLQRFTTHHLFLDAVEIWSWFEQPPVPKFATMVFLPP